MKLYTALSEKSVRSKLSPEPYQCYEGGYTLTIVLLFVMALGGILAGIVYDNNKTENQQAAVSTGENLAEIARAARIFVRDRSLDVPGSGIAANPGNTDDYHRNRLAPAGMVADIGDGSPSTGPVRTITVTSLINAGLLPFGFGNNGTGVYRTPLGHQIFIIAANVPVDDDPTAAGSDAVASAYIFIAPGAENSLDQINDIVVGLRKEGVSVSAPMYNAAGANISSTTCRGTPAVAIWDTGCLNDTEFTTLSGIADPDAGGPLTAFPPGGLVIPAWRAAQFDLRAVMRFPQPENPGYATMLTSLNMSECDGAAGNIFVNDDTGINTVDTGLCNTVADNEATAIDNRFDIRNIKDFETNAAIVTPQTNDVTTYYDTATSSYVVRNDAATTAAFGRNNDILITWIDSNGNGNVDVGETTLVDGDTVDSIADAHFIARGDTIVLNDVKTFNIGGSDDVRLGDATFGRSAVVNNAAIPTNIGTLTTDSARADTYNQNDPGDGVFNPNSIRLETLDANGKLTVSNNMTTRTLTVNSNNFTTNDTTLSGSVNLNGVNITAGGTTLPGGYKAAIANLQRNSMGPSQVNITGNFVISDADPTNSGEFNSNTVIAGTLDIEKGDDTATCLSTTGDCPDRCPFPVFDPITGTTICP